MWEGFEQKGRLGAREEKSDRKEGRLRARKGKGESRREEGVRARERGRVRA